MAGAKRIILLGGAPLADSLAWDEDSLNPDVTSSDAVDWILKGDISSGRQHSTQDPTATTSFAYPVWRSVECDEQEISHPPDTDSDSLLSRNKVQKRNIAATRPSRTESQDDFLEHSYALLDNLDTSQLVAAASYGPILNTADTTYMSTTSFTASDGASSLSTSDVLDPTSDSLIPTSDSDTPHAVVPQNIPIADLKRLPSAQHIISLHPQTITINLIAGIIALSPPRTVQLRRRNAEMDIHELTVGDDTRAGFRISFWLAPVESQQFLRHGDSMRETLCGLRSGDVVLMRNVALTSFRGCVYGQSLPRRRFGGRGTEVVGLAAGVDGPGGFAAKFRRVRQWAEDFVGVTRAPGQRGAKRKAREDLPPDTPG